MKLLIDLMKEYAPFCPPFVGIVCLYLFLNFVAYLWTRERGFLVCGGTGGLFLLPYLMHS